MFPAVTRAVVVLFFIGCTISRVAAEDAIGTPAFFRGKGQFPDGAATGQLTVFTLTQMPSEDLLMRIVKSDSNGLFQIKGSSNGTAVGAYDQSLKLGGVVWVPNVSTEAKITLRPTAQLKGKVVWDQSNLPLKNHRIHVSFPAGHYRFNATFGDRLAIVNDTGEFEVAGLLPGIPYQISVSTEAFPEAERFPPATLHRLFDLEIFHGGLITACETRIGKDATTGRIEVVPRISLTDARRFKIPDTDAQLELNTRLQLLQEPDERILINFGGGVGCTPCAYLNQLLALTEKQLGSRIRTLHLDVTQPGGEACLDRLRPKGGSLPWLAVIDRNGHIVASGDRATPDQIPVFEYDRNLSFPDSPVAVSQYLNLLKVAAPRLTDEDVRPIAALLGYPDPSKLPACTTQPELAGKP